MSFDYERFSMLVEIAGEVDSINLSTTWKIDQIIEGCKRGESGKVDSESICKELRALKAQVVIQSQNAMRIIKDNI